MITDYFEGIDSSNDISTSIGCMFSVCMVVTQHDDADYFSAAMSSVVNQSMRPTEILLVENGELTQKHHEVIVEQQCKSNIRVVKLNGIRPIGEARNVALHNAKYSVIALADPDDINEPDRFMEVICKLNKKIRMVGSQMREFRNKLHDINVIRRVPCDYKKIVWYSKLRSPVNNPTLCFFKKDALEVGGYNPFLNFGEDYDLIMRFIESGKVILNIPTVTVNFRIGDKHRLSHKRGGFCLLRKEIYLHKLFFRNGYISGWNFMCVVTIKLLCRLLPAGLLNILYVRILRTNE